MELRASETLIGTQSGHFVTQKWADLSEMLDDYAAINFTFLELRWVPPTQRIIGESPYVVVGRDRQGEEYAVLYAEESDDPIDVMGRIFYSHQKQGDVVDRMEARNRAAKLFDLKKREEELAAKEDHVRFLMGSKNYKIFKHPVTGEMVKVDDQLNHTATKKVM